ncbi:pyricularia oryzae resistance 21-like protein [Tanacetum coccineum]
MAPEKEKITVMILYVDLKCPCCYKKVRKLLCKFPQIRDQVFDVDKNKVIITVVCCDPEKLRDKLCCKGGGVIQSIEIVENKPPLEKRIRSPSPNGSPKDTPDKKLEKKPSEELKSPPPESEKTEPDPPVSACCQECYEGRDGGPCHHGYGRPVPPQVPEKCKPCPPKSADPPRPTCCQECYEGRDGGPCHYGYGRPVSPPPCYYYSGYLYPSNKPCYVSRCDSFSEDNPQGCSIM